MVADGTSDSGRCLTLSQPVQRHPVQERGLAAARVRIGRRFFDDGCYITERTLTPIGHDCTLNALSKIQSHSQEDGTFKSDAHLRFRRLHRSAPACSSTTASRSATARCSPRTPS